MKFDPDSEIRSLWAEGTVKELKDNLKDNDNFDKSKFAFEIVSGKQFVDLDETTGRVIFKKDMSSGNSVKIRAYSTEIPEQEDFFTFKTSYSFVEINISDVPDSDEENIGGFVMVNDDDDNGDLNVDHGKKYEIGGGTDNDLRRLDISYLGLPEISSKHPLKLILFPLTTTGVKVWRSPDRSGDAIVFHGGTASFESISDVPSTLWFEALSPNVCGLKISYYHKDTGRLTDTIKMTSVYTSISLEGIPNERTIREGSKIVRVEPYEFSTGAWLRVNTDRSPDDMKILSVVRPSPNNLPSDSSILVRWDSDKLEIRNEADFSMEPLAPPLQIRLSDYPNPQVTSLNYYVNPVKESEMGRDIVITSEYQCPDGTLCEDKISVTNCLLNLRTDSNNNVSLDVEDDLVEENFPGKVFAVNQNDGDNDGIPDYADLGEGLDINFAPMTLAIGENFDMKKLKLKFAYSGLKKLPDPNEFKGKKVSFDFKEYRDYTAVKKGDLRIWRIENELTTTRKTSDIADGGNYLVPNKEYLAEDLFKGSREIKLHVEGINPSEGAIRLVAEYENYAGNIVEFSDEVKILCVQGDIGVNTTNDITSTINDKDEIIEDQLDGFIFWKSRDEGAKVSEMGIIDTFPLKVEIQEELVGWKLYLDVEAKSILPSFDVYGNDCMADGGTDRIAYLKDQEKAERQMGKENLFRVTSNNPQEIKFTDFFGDEKVKEFLLKCPDQEKAQCRIILLAAPPYSPDNKIELDSVKVSVKQTKELMHAVSTRGTPDNPVTYTTEEGRYVENYKAYPEANPIDGYAQIDNNKDRILLMIHGYSVSEGGAPPFWDEMFKRFYWTGYRGNLIALTWEGDEFMIGPVPSLTFGKNIENALQTSPSLADYLINMKLAYPKQRINVIAHSLGNLVIMDALRLLDTRTRKKLVNNVLHVEPAVWRETLDPKSGFVDNGYQYTIDQQQKVSWRHWLSRYNKTVSGNTVNAYNPGDRVLTFVMRSWQTITADSGINIWEPARSENLTEFRTPYLLWHDIPGWPNKMDTHPILPTLPTDIKLPMGAGEVVHTVNVNENGQDYNWQTGFSGHSSWYVEKYYVMHGWFKDVFIKTIEGK